MHSLKKIFKYAKAHKMLKLQSSTCNRKWPLVHCREWIIENTNVTITTSLKNLQWLLYIDKAPIPQDNPGFPLALYSRTATGHFTCVAGSFPSLWETPWGAPSYLSIKTQAEGDIPGHSSPTPHDQGPCSLPRCGSSVTNSVNRSCSVSRTPAHKVSAKGISS